MIDDMFIESYSEIDPTNQVSYAAVNVMSQLRLGSSDFNVNFDHV